MISNFVKKLNKIEKIFQTVKCINNETLNIFH